MLLLLAKTELDRLDFCGHSCLVGVVEPIIQHTRRRAVQFLFSLAWLAKSQRQQTIFF